jgi:short-subunit dehydrogenase
MARRFERAIVVGASSGIGEAVARQLAAAGTRVALVARRQERLDAIVKGLNQEAGEERAIAAVHDVGSAAEVPQLLQDLARRLGGLDLVVYAAGVMHRTALDEYDPVKGLEMLQVNLAGAVAWLEPVAERFQRLGSGTIVGIGSVAGDRGRAPSPVYGASKAGLHTYLEGLRNRLRSHGVDVVTIRPGFVDTAMVRGLGRLPWVIAPERAARIILARARRGVVNAYVPARWRWLMLVVRSIPSFVFCRLKI